VEDVMSDNTLCQDSAETADEFDLDISLLEMADPAGLVNVTDDGCGSTCGACTTNPG
jgi:FxLD family lantipeptide